MSDYPALRTQLQKGHPQGLQELRVKRINEALSWSPGPSLEAPNKHVVTTLPDGKEAYFLKPGKEVFRTKNPNPNDMTPCVGDGDERYEFRAVWTELSKVSAHDFDLFKLLLLLMYRNANFIDHVEVDEGLLRYQPSEDVLEVIDEIEESTSGIHEYGTFGFLHFLDLLGWNEDVKYHVEDGSPTFTGKSGWKVGRPNTILTCINVPYKTYNSVHEIRDAESLEDIDWSKVYETMQRMMRGVSTPTQKELLEWLSPYLVSSSHQREL